MRQRLFVLAAAGLLAIPATASAQVPWDTPFHMGPGQSGGLGIHLVDFETGPGSDGIGAAVTWRRAPVPGGLGFRAGLAEGFDGELAVFGGVDFSGYLVRESADVPLDLSWALGAGAGIGDYAILSFPASIIVGKTLDAEGVRFVPYIGPRVDLDAYLGRDGPQGDDLELAFTVDLGTDIVVSDQLTIRFGAAVGGSDDAHEALSIGIILPGVS